MPHIHSEPGQVDSTVTAFIVRLDGAAPRVLMHMHKKYQRLMPVGGHIELNETPWAAVAHEILEEAGYEFNQLQVMQPALRIDSLPGIVQHPMPFRFNTHTAAQNHYHTDVAYLFVTKVGPARAPAEGESTDIRWITRSELLEIPDNMMRADTRQSALEVFDRFLPGWEPVATDRYALELPNATL